MVFTQVSPAYVSGIAKWIVSQVQGMHLPNMSVFTDVPTHGFFLVQQSWVTALVHCTVIQVSVLHTHLWGVFFVSEDVIGTLFQSQLAKALPKAKVLLADQGGESGKIPVDASTPNLTLVFLEKWCQKETYLLLHIKANVNKPVPASNPRTMPIIMAKTTHAEMNQANTAGENLNEKHRKYNAGCFLLCSSPSRHYLFGKFWMFPMPFRKPVDCLQWKEHVCSPSSKAVIGCIQLSRIRSEFRHDGAASTAFTLFAKTDCKIFFFTLLITT